MKWQIPAKTFALGEYVALKGGPAILLLTSPSFVMRVTDPPNRDPSPNPNRDREGAENLLPPGSENLDLQGIHPNSPAGRFWRAQGFKHGLCFEDPYEGRGGFGASSAQFVGAYRAYCELRGLSFDRETLLSTYQQFATVGSGYDVLAQSVDVFGNSTTEVHCFVDTVLESSCTPMYTPVLRSVSSRTVPSVASFQRRLVHTNCVYIHRAANIFEPFEWPFKSLQLSLIHTGHKCRTHEHLAELQSDQNLSKLTHYVQQAKNACDHQDEQQFVDLINAYHAELFAQGLMSLHSDEKVREFRQQPGVLAAKGCGAMGSDVILLLSQ